MCLSIWTGSCAFLTFLICPVCLGGGIIKSKKNGGWSMLKPWKSRCKCGRWQSIKYHRKTSENLLITFLPWGISKCKYLQVNLHYFHGDVLFYLPWGWYKHKEKIKDLEIGEIPARLKPQTGPPQQTNMKQVCCWYKLFWGLLYIYPDTL